MKSQMAWVAIYVCAIVVAPSAGGQQGADSSQAAPAQAAPSKDFVDALANSQKEHEAKMAAARAGITDSAKPAAGASGEVESWANIQDVAVADQRYQMTAFSVGVPAGWRFEGSVVRGNGCHGGAPSLAYQLRSPDGQIAIQHLPAVRWSWITNSRARANMRCEPVELFSAADFLVNIVVPNLHAQAKVLEVLPPTREGAEAIEQAIRLDQERQTATAELVGVPPTRALVDGARIHILYEQNGQQFEEMIMTAVHCADGPQGRTCESSGGETVVRTPAGYLSAVLANRDFIQFAMDVKDNPDWERRVAFDQQQTFLRMWHQQNVNSQMVQQIVNAQFQQSMQNSAMIFQQMMANSRAFNARQDAQFQAHERNQIQIQRSMNWQARQTELFALDEKEYINPSNGHIVTASNRFNQVWGSADGSLLAGTTGAANPNDYTAPGAPVLTPLTPRN